MADGKGHTEALELSLIRRDDVIILPVVGVVARRPNHPENAENWEKYIDLIVTAVNTYPAVEGLVKALEAGLAFYDGLTRPHENGEAQVLDAMQTSLSRFRSHQNGGAS